MTQPRQREPKNRQQNWFSERWYSGKNPVTTGWMGKRGLSAYNAQFMPIDLKVEKNQVIRMFNIISPFCFDWSANL